MQGKVEERLPFVSITLPQYFNSYPAHMKNFKDNVNIMSSHFDIISNTTAYINLAASQ